MSRKNDTKYKVTMQSGEKFEVEINKTFKEFMKLRNENNNLEIGEELFLSSKYIEANK